MFDRHYQFNLTCSDTTGILESSECVVQLDVSKASDDSASYNLFNVTSHGVLSLKNDVNRSSITKLVIPTSLDGTDITSIDNDAFASCPSLTSVNLGSVTTIGDYAFENCSSLTSVDLGSVTTIGIYAFRYCPSLTFVDLRSVTTIGYAAFQNCPSLNSVTYTAPGTFGDDSLVLVDQDGIVQGPGEEITIDTASDGGGFMTQ